MGPTPRPENIHQQALHEALRHVNEQAIDLTKGHRLEVHADRFEWPTIDQLGGGLDHGPEVMDEVDQPAAACLCPAQLLKVLVSLFPVLDFIQEARGLVDLLTSAPMVPHFVQTIFDPNDGTVRSPGRWSTFITTSWRH
jgi:hypothetical protein